MTNQEFKIFMKGYEFAMNLVQLEEEVGDTFVFRQLTKLEAKRLAKKLESWDTQNPTDMTAMSFDCDTVLKYKEEK